MASPSADREKFAAALSSVVAAVALTGLKAVVGFVTGSLGILAEAAHSALDFGAALLTLVAVGVSARPADASHTYGHGKVENFSALAQTGLLLATCAWIIWEAVQRLAFKHVNVESSIWAFLVMAASIAVDYSRTRVLRRAARKHGSQALEADALHFSTDMWSSSVVIVGLVFVAVSDWLALPWLAKADALAALGVSALVIYVAIDLGRRSSAALLDGVSPGLREAVAAAARVAGVQEVRRVRVRQSGAESFADIVVTVDRQASLEDGHAVATRVEGAVGRLFQRGDVLVHVEPGTHETAHLPSLVRSVANRHGLGAHEIRYADVLGRTSLELHVEIDEATDVAGAHTRVSRFEEDLRQAAPQLERIVTHIEPSNAPSPGVEPVATSDQQALVDLVIDVAGQIGITCAPHDVEVQQTGTTLSLTFHLTVDGKQPLAEAHRLTEQLEAALRRRLPRLGNVTIHVEPVEGNVSDLDASR